MAFLLALLSWARGSAAPEAAQAPPLTVCPGRVETRFGNRDRVVFRIQAPEAGAYPVLLWTVRKADGGSARGVAHVVDPTGDQGVFLPFPVEQTTLCQVRVTVAGTSRFGEAILVVRPPYHAGTRRPEGCPEGAALLGA